MGDERKYLHAGVVRDKSDVAGTGGSLWVVVKMVMAIPRGLILRSRKERREEGRKEDEGSKG